MTRAAVLLPLLLLAAAGPARGEEPAAKAPPPPAARVVAAVSKAAAENAALPEAKRLSGDALGDRYVRRAAAAAEGDATAFLAGLAHALDPAGTLASNSLTRRAFEGLETAEEAAARRRVLGSPALRGRDDLLLHFAVSAALSALVGDAIAGAAGVAKEMADLRAGTGFSFADLLADDAGIAFRRWLAKDAASRLPRVAEAFVGTEHCPDPAGLPEGIDAEAFARDYGGVLDPRFAARRKEVSDRVAALAAKREPPVPAPAPSK